MPDWRSGLTFALCIVILASGCALCPPVDPHQETISRISDYLVPLSKAVDVVVEELPPDSKDDEIFSAVMKRSGDPELLKPFEGYVLKGQIEDGVGVILLCSPNGKEGIIEDVTCTTRPDAYRPTGSPCTYLLDVRRVCSTP
jgi:hypothetical protein